MGLHLLGRICWICWLGSVENSFAFVGWSLYPDTHSVPMMTRYILLYQIPQIFQIYRFTQIHPKHSLVGDLTSEMAVIEYKSSRNITDVVELQGLGFSRTSLESLLGITL